MYIIPLQIILLYFISEYLHRSLAYGSRILYIILMLPGTIVHEASHALMALLMGSRVTKFSVIPSGDALGYVEFTPPKIPIIGNVAISTAPLIGCPAILLLISRYFGIKFEVPPNPLDIPAQTGFLIEHTFSFITGLDYMDWRTFLFLYLAITLGAGAAPSKTDILNMLPGLFIIVVSIFILNYSGVNILFMNNIFYWLSAVLTIAIIPLLGVTAIVSLLKLLSFHLLP